MDLPILDTCLWNDERWKFLFSRNVYPSWGGRHVQTYNIVSIREMPKDHKGIWLHWKESGTEGMEDGKTCLEESLTCTLKNENMLYARKVRKNAPGNAATAGKGLLVELPGALKGWAYIWVQGGEECQKVTKSIFLLVLFWTQEIFFKNPLEIFTFGQSPFIGPGSIIRSCAISEFLILKNLHLLRKCIFKTVNNITMHN